MLKRSDLFRFKSRKIFRWKDWNPGTNFRNALSNLPQTEYEESSLLLHTHKDDSEPIEWGDMDPSFAKMLQSTPSMLQAYPPKKMAKLDTSLGSFQPSTNVAIPEPSPTVTNNILHTELGHRAEQHHGILNPILLFSKNAGNGPVRVGAHRTKAQVEKEKDRTLFGFRFLW